MIIMAIVLLLLDILAVFFVQIFRIFVLVHKFSRVKFISRGLSCLFVFIPSFILFYYFYFFFVTSPHFLLIFSCKNIRFFFRGENLGFKSRIF